VTVIRQFLTIAGTVFGQNGSQITTVPEDQLGEAMNNLYATTKQGTVGELLVQLRLLEHEVQAAPPIKDSGNDLIAIRGREFRAVQVKTTTTGTIEKPGQEVLYHLLAIVHLQVGQNGRYTTDGAKIYLFGSEEVPALKGRVSDHPEHLMTQGLIDQLIPPPR
jgi:hypothetical protein